jgi:hypothetical protein
VNFETRRKKQQALMLQMLERKVRSRARQLYESRGKEEGQALEDWFKAEAEVLDRNSFAPLYRKLISADPAQANSTEGSENLAETVSV